MRAALDPHPNLAAIAVDLRIDLVAWGSVETDPYWSILAEFPLADPAPGADWQPLGYDVADTAYISALTNCGYQPDEASALRAAWTGRLNQHGLFETLEDADAFRALTDRRIAAHAPFQVFALSASFDR